MAKVDVGRDGKAVMLRTTEAAKRLGISRVRVNQLIEEYRKSKGERGIRAEEMGPRMWLCYAESVDAYAKNRRPPGRPPKEK